MERPTTIEPQLIRLAEEYLHELNKAPVHIRDAEYPLNYYSKLVPKTTKVNNRLSKMFQYLK